MDDAVVLIVVNVEFSTSDDDDDPVAMENELRDDEIMENDDYHEVATKLGKSKRCRSESDRKLRDIQSHPQMRAICRENTCIQSRSCHLIDSARQRQI